MKTLHFFLGSGWLTTWYIVFYIAGVIPSLMFLAYVRRSRRYQPGEGLMISFSLGYELLAVLSTINAFLLAVSIPSHSAFTYVAALLAAMGLLLVYYYFTRTCVELELIDRKLAMITVHGMVILLLLLNLYSLWLFQNRHTLQTWQETETTTGAAAR